MTRKRHQGPLGPQNDLGEDGDPVDSNWSARLIADMERQRTRVSCVAPSEVRRHRERKAREERERRSGSDGGEDE